MERRFQSGLKNRYNDTINFLREKCTRTSKAERNQLLRDTNPEGRAKQQELKVEPMYQCFHRQKSPHRDKTNKMACAPSEDSDQPGHTDSEDSDQTGRMPRLI